MVVVGEVCVNEQQHFPSFSCFCYLSTRLFGPGPYSCTFPLWHSTLSFLGVFFSSMLFHFDPLSLSLSSSLGPLLYPLSLLCFLKSLSVFLLSPAVLHSCFGREGGGQGRGREKRGRGNLSFREGGWGKGGRRAPFFMRMPSAGSAERRTPAWLKP